MMRLILASGSPRRKLLLERLGLPFDAVATGADEAPPKGKPPRVAVQEIAERKLDAYLTRPDARRDTFVLVVDTEVYIDGALQGKPADAKAATEMLRRLSGKSHIVYSGIVVREPHDRRHRHVEASTVTFAALSDDQIRSYVGTKEPLDKAGGYGVQGQGAAFIERVEGDYTNVIGLPIRPTLRLLTRAGFPLPPHLRVS
jgi:septum formation protein